MKMDRNFFVAAIVAGSKSRFYFVQRHGLRQKRCEACSFQGMLHQATIRATCVACNGATKLRDKLQEIMSSVTAP